ncbi:MAG: tetratricopeptide repeat protein [Bacteroidota bacterium]|nr:tetratricopeptide repeat protein [Bacteroidota bacterium]
MKTKARLPLSLSVMGGVFCGIVVSNGLEVARRLWPSAVFGILPVFLAAVIGTAIALRGFRVTRKLSLPGLPAFTAGILAPLLVYALSVVSSDFAFISGEAAFLPFVFLALLYGVLVSAPLASMGATAPEEDGHVKAGLFLASAAVAHGVMQAISGGIDLRILFLVQVLAGVALLFARHPEPAPTVLSVASTGGKAGKKPQRSSPAVIVPPALIVPVFFALAVWMQYASSVTLEWSLPEKTYTALLVPGVTLFFAGGLALGRMLRGRKHGVMTLLVPVVLSAFTAPAAFALMNGAVFESVYRAYFEGASVAVPLAILCLIAHLLPAVSAGTLAGYSRTGDAGRRFPLYAGGAVALGAIAGAVLPLHALAAWVASASALSWAGVAMYAVMSLRPIRVAQVVLALAAAVAVLLPATVNTEGIRSLVVPDRFIVRAEKQVPGGRYAFLQSRDYDDPFHTAVWNYTTPLTQDSRLVQPALYRLGHLPMLMHEDPQSVLLLGFGSGKALEAVKMHKPAKVVCVEPVKALMWYADSTARREFRRSVTSGVRFHIERPASYVARSAETFDVIVSPEPFASPYPDMAVFTPAHYRRVAGLLRPGGVFAQCIPLSRVTGDGMRAVCASMAAAFPHREMWLANADVDNAMACILGSETPFPPTRPDSARFAKLRADALTNFHLMVIGWRSWKNVLSEFGLDGTSLDAFAGGAKPVSRFAPPMLAPGEPGSEERWKNAFELFERRTLPKRVFTELDDSLRRGVTNAFEAREAVLRAGASSARGDDTTATLILYDILRSQPDHAEAAAAMAEILLRRAVWLVGNEKYAEAVPVLNQVIRLVPLNTLVLRLRMIAAMQMGDKAAAGECIEGIRRLDPRHAGFRDNQATIRARQGAIEDALLLYRNAITLDPTNVDFYCNMASVQFGSRRAWEAVRLLDEAVQKAFYPAKALYLRGLFYREAGRYDLARESWKRYLDIALPTDPKREEVEKALRALGR